MCRYSNKVEIHNDLLFKVHRFRTVISKNPQFRGLQYPILILYTRITILEHLMLKLFTFSATIENSHQIFNFGNHHKFYKRLSEFYTIFFMHFYVSFHIYDFLYFIFYLILSNLFHHKCVKYHTLF